MHEREKEGESKKDATKIAKVYDMPVRTPNETMIF